MVTLPSWGVQYAFPAACLAAVTAIVVLVRPALHDDATTARAREAAPLVRPAAQQPPRRVRSFRATAYSVRSGDTLEVIAERFGTTVDRLLQLNPGIEPNALRVGQVLRVN
jgi:hypothetical protein